MLILGNRDHRGHAPIIAALLLLLTPHVAAKVKPGQISENANPDASGRVKFYAPRLDMGYPGSWGTTKPNSWTLELNITRNGTDGPNRNQRAPLFTLQPIPPSPGLEGAAYFPNGSYTAGDVDAWTIERDDPQRWFVQVGVPSWNRDLEVPEGNDKERGTCPESIWTKECVSAMRKAIQAQDHYNRFDITGLPACEGQPEPRFPWGSSITQQDDFTTFSIQRDSVPDVYNTQEEYDKRGLSTFPVLLVFNIPYWLKTPQPPLPDENIIFACVKVDTVHNGAKMPTGDTTRASAQKVAGHGWLAMWFGTVSAFILLCKGPGGIVHD